MRLTQFVWDKIADVLRRPKCAAAISRDRREMFLELILAQAAWFQPATRIADCRDPNDNKYLEVALEADLHPWRGLQIILAADYLFGVSPPR